MFLLDCDQNLLPIVSFIKNGFLPIIQMGVPIILIVMGSVDLGKAVLSSDDKEIKAATSRLIKRAVAAVMVFFVATIVTLLMGLFTNNSKSNPKDTNTTSWADCWGAV